ncbi:putative 50S ribosomal subunit L7/L12 [Candidatus Hodgkinia cicadicola]|nr:putative 50S ribosomal subunit L7/L12 [Candidatus Hodgkinia cicadicola]
MSKIDDIAQQLCELRVSELAELSLLLEAKWGVSPVAAAPKSEVNAKAKAVHDVVLIKPGQSKIAIIKEIRSLLSLGLKEAKEFVDNAPKPIKCGLDKSEAAALKAKFEALGAEVELR